MLVFPPAEMQKNAFIIIKPTTVEQAVHQTWVRPEGKIHFFTSKNLKKMKLFANLSVPEQLNERSFYYTILSCTHNNNNTDLQKLQVEILEVAKL